MRDKRKVQQAFIKQLRETGNVVSSCHKAKVPRSTIYRWRLGDDDFLNDFEEAQEEGRFIMSSLAESVVIANIRDKNQRASEFYLRHNSPQYRTKPKLTDMESLDLSDRRLLMLLDLMNYNKKLKHSLEIQKNLQYHNEQLRQKRR